MRLPPSSPHLGTCLHLVGRAWKGAALLALGIAGLAGCGGSRQASSAAQPLPPCPSEACALVEQLRHGAGDCRFDPAMLARPLTGDAQTVLFKLDPSRTYEILIGGQERLHVHGDLAAVHLVGRADKAQVTSVVVSGEPARLTDVHGQLLFSGMAIRLHLDAHGLTSVDLPGDSGSMFAAPTALWVSTQG